LAPVEISLDLRLVSQHLIGVRLRFTPRQPSLSFRLPAWTPGSYLLRDYVRHLESLEVWQEHGSGEPPPMLPKRLVPRRVGPASWQLALEQLGPIEIRYAVLATELSVRTCHLDTDHGFLALAAVALQVEGERWTPHRLTLQLPEAWSPFVPLPVHSDGSWLAEHFDQLIDTPIEAGPHGFSPFEVRGAAHRWVSWEDGPADQARLLSRFPSLLLDVAAVCEACCDLMGEAVPAAPDYLFILHLLEHGYGGLEHDRSTVLQFSRQALAKPDGYRRLLQLIAHEYLHQWNVRRLRPAELTPIDYDRPVIVPTLWFAEGVTSYFDQFLPLLAGRSSERQLFEDLGADLSRYRLTPGRLQGQTLRQSGEEAWVKLYRRDAYSDDSQISYYLKGAVVSLVLDLALRRAASCLAEVLRDLWRSLGRCGKGYSEELLVQTILARAPDLADDLPRWLESFDDPDLDAYLHDVGLQLQAVVSADPYTGFRCEREQAELKVQRVQRHGPGQQAGLVVGDELIAIDGLRLRRPDDLPPLLVAGRPQQLTISRRGCLRQLSLRASPAEVERWTLDPDPNASPQALRRRTEWLGLLPC